MSQATIGDGNLPVYRFDFDDGRSRRTDEGIEADVVSPDAVEILADRARSDPDCEVTLVGFG